MTEFAATGGVSIDFGLTSNPQDPQIIDTLATCLIKSPQVEGTFNGARVQPNIVALIVWCDIFLQPKDSSWVFKEAVDNHKM